MFHQFDIDDLLTPGKPIAKLLSGQYDLSGDTLVWREYVELHEHLQEPTGPMKATVLQRIKK